MTLKNPKFRATILTIAIVAIFIGGVLVAKLWAQRVTNLHQSLQRFSYILNLVINDYVQDVDADKLVNRALDSKEKEISGLPGI